MISTNKIIFVVGNSRSGTTMLGRILGKNSQINTFEELHYFEQLIDPSEVRIDTIWTEFKLITMLERLLTSARDGYYEKVSVGKYSHEAKLIIKQSQSLNPSVIYQYFLNYETQNNNKDIPCKQTPKYLFSANEILAFYPDAKIINIIRDPRAVLLSQKNRWKRRFLGSAKMPISQVLRSWTNYHPILFTKLWKSCVRKANTLKNDPRFLSIQFEDLLKDPEKVVSKISDFLCIEYEPEMILVPNVGSSSGKDSPSKNGIDASKAQAWREGGLSRTELYICQKMAHEEMKDLFYIKIETGLPVFGIIFSYLSVVLKLVLSILLNFTKNKNFIATIKRRLI